MSTENVSLGIIGLGNMGSNYARRIINNEVDGFKLVAVADTNPDRLREFSSVSCYTDSGKLFSGGEVDAVLISTPHYSHTTIGIQALNAGLHVLVDKPISVHKADCERLISAYKPEAGQIFAAMFNQRTDPRYRKLRSLIQNGDLGAIQRINWVITDWFRPDRYYESGGWRATWAGEGGGVLLNQCPHQLDLWQWLFGMPDKVTAFCQIGRFHNIEVEDSVTAVLEYSDGVQGVFITTTGEAPGTNRLEVVGEYGSVLVGSGDDLHFRRNEISSVRYCRESDKAFTAPDVWDVTIPVKGKGEQHVGILKNFVAAIRNGEPLLSHASEGIYSVELANSMMLSSIRGETIHLPLDAKEFEGELKKKIEASIFIKKTVKTEVADDFNKSFRV